ncbi:MAG: peptidyl-prolyl cis-trans isomerase, partial [Opitutales bacterium]|nr:peptidyl-prolyl cis-trans isomerase [Opitutales bacterium]
SYLPKYEDVKAKVLENYIASEKSRLFNERANTLAKALAKAVAEKKSFASVAREGGAKVESVKDFVMTEPKGDAVMRAYSAINSTLPTLKVGAVSPVKTFGGNAYIFELTKFTAPAEKADANKLKNISKRMIGISSMITSMSVLSEKVQAQEKNLQEEQQ